MSDYNRFTLKRVRDMIRTYILYKYVYRKEKQLHIGQSQAVWFIWICINITNELNYFLPAVFL